MQRVLSCFAVNLHVVARYEAGAIERERGVILRELEEVNTQLEEVRHAMCGHSLTPATRHHSSPLRLSHQGSGAGRGRGGGELKGLL